MKTLALLALSLICGGCEPQCRLRLLHNERAEYFMDVCTAAALGKRPSWVQARCLEAAEQRGLTVCE